MRRKKIGIILAASFLVMIVLTGCYCYEIYLDYRVPVPYTGRIMSVPVVEDLDFLEGKEKCFAETNPGVCFGGALLPYTKDGTLYLSQDFAVEEWIGEITADTRDKFLCTLYDPAWEDKAGSIRDNHIFTLWLVDGENYYELSMTVCGMPVMTISTQREEQQDLGDYDADPDRFIYDPSVIYYGQMQLFDPGVGTGQYEIMEFGVRYHERGASALSPEKKGYSIGLLDAGGENFDASLLGMRSDNSWKLKGLGSDSSRIREKTAYQIWEQFALANTEVNEAGPHMEYLELIMDNDYAGLYGIIEPVDEKKLELDKNDVLYKMTNWFVPTEEEIQTSIDNKWRIATYIRIRYPDEIADYEEAWYPMRDYLDTFYQEGVDVREYQGSSYQGGGDGRPAESKVYLSNAMDVLLFNMAVSGCDNYYKNMYFAADVAEDGTYVMRQIPWDLDLTFGETYTVGFNDDETVVYEEAAIPFLRDKSPQLVRPSLKERWGAYREGFLSTENIEKLLCENRDYLLCAGVNGRENARWPQYSMTDNIDGMLDYQERRMNWLDEYFEKF